MAGSELEFQRALEAVKRGWVTPEQISAVLRRNDTAESLLEALRGEGLLDSAQIDVLRRAAVSAAGAAPPDAAEPLSLGDVIAERYAIERIFQGGFGRVFICMSRREGRRVALKTLLRKHLEREDVLQLFRAEMLHWIELGSHPNIVYAYGLEQFLRLPFVVMEYVQGEALSKKIEENRTDARLAVDVGIQAARGLEHARKVNGMVHRDLKPDNILVASDGTAKVTDFGLALVRRADAPQLGFAGTVQYMAPEQWRDPNAVDVRADIYSMGVILFEMAAGSRPFPEHRTIDEYGHDHCNVRPPDPRSIRSDVPAGLSDLILRCLEKKASDRPSDFGTLGRMLESLSSSGRTNRGATPPLPDRVDALVNQSKSYANLNMAEEALDAAEKAVRLDGGHSGARLVMGNAFLLLRRFDEALSCFETAHRLDPDDVAPMANAAIAALNAGNRSEALAWVRKTVAHVEDLRDAPSLEGFTFAMIELESPEVSLRVCNQIVESNPMSVVVWNNRAILLRRMGRLNEALQSAQKAIELNPRYAKGWSNRATILAQSGRFEDAIQAADEAIRCEPTTAGAYTAKAAALGSLGRLTEGRKCLEQGLRVMPNHPLLLRALQQF